MSSLKKGQFITAYHAGIHRVTRVEPVCYNEWNVPAGSKPGDFRYNIIHYVKVTDANGNPVKEGISNSCVESECRLATDYVRKEVEKINKIIQAIK